MTEIFYSHSLKEIAQKTYSTLLEKGYNSDKINFDLSKNSRCKLITNTKKLYDTEKDFSVESFVLLYNLLQFPSKCMFKFMEKRPKNIKIKNNGIEPILLKFGKIGKHNNPIDEKISDLKSQISFYNNEYIGCNPNVDFGLSNSILIEDYQENRLKSYKLKRELVILRNQKKDLDGNYFVQFISQ